MNKFLILIPMAVVCLMTQGCGLQDDQPSDTSTSAQMDSDHIQAIADSEEMSVTAIALYQDRIAQQDTVCSEIQSLGDQLDHQTDPKKAKALVDQMKQECHKLKDLQ